MWNTWKGKLLEDLYRITLAVLGGANPDAHSELKSRQEQALALLRLETVPDDAHRALWDQLDVGFFLRHDAADIAWQTRVLYRHVNAETAIVRARPSPIGDALQVLVYVKDRPDLFAGICAYFDRNGARCSTHGSARRGTAMRSTTSSSRRPKVTCGIATSRISSSSNSRRGSQKPHRCRSRPRAACRGCPGRFRSRRASTCGPTSAASTTSCPCRPTTGRAFYSIARVLAEHRIGVHAARINTLGERVEDIFLLAGAGLSDNRLQIQLETELLRAIAV